MSHAAVCPYGCSNGKKYTDLQTHIRRYHADQACIDFPNNCCNLCSPSNPDRFFLSESAVAEHKRRMHQARPGAQPNPLHMLANAAIENSSSSAAAASAANEETNSNNEVGLHTLTQAAQNAANKNAMNNVEGGYRRSHKRARRSHKKTRRFHKKSRSRSRRN